MIAISSAWETASPSDGQHNFTRAVSSVAEFNRVSFKIEADGTIGAVVNDESHWATVRKSSVSWAFARLVAAYLGKGSCA
jgi:hypothetical protein